MDELDLDAFLTVEEHIPNVTSVNPLGNMSDGSFYPARNVSGRCGLMDENYIQVWQTFQWWCEGVLFSGVGLAGLIANCFSIGILCTRDMRKHSFNQLLIALCVFDLLFIIVSIPVYSFNLFQIFVGNQFFNYLYVHVLYPMSPVTLCASVYMTVALTIERWLAVCKPITYRNMNQTMSTSRRVAMYVTPVAVVSICLNIPKFMENEVKETDNTTQIDIAEMRLHPTYMLYYTISQIFHPTLTTGLVPMGVLIFMNLAIYKGIRRTTAMRNQRRQNLNTHLNSQSAAAVQLQGTQMQQLQQQQQQQRSSETSLAIALMGIVIMHIVCQLLRVFLAGLAVYFVHDTLWCIRHEGGFAPPLWTMCAESISSLLIMINFSGNFLIYCSMLPPFKEALSKICAFFCFWNWRNRQPDSGSIEENMPETIATGSTLLPPAVSNGNDNRNRRTTVLISREPVSGEPPKAARVFRLFSKRSLSHNKRSRKFPEDDYVETVPALLSHNGNNGIGTNGTLLSTTNNDSDLVVQVTIEAAGKSEQAAKDEITT